MSVEQLTLDDAPLVRRSDPDTSHTAAAAQTPQRRSRGQFLVLTALANHGPLTDFDHAQINGLGQTSAGKRRLELQRQGLVEPTGQRRPSPTGSPAKVWTITSTGMVRYHELLRSAAERGEW